MLKVTTSWDDGDVHDIRLSNLLSRYGIKGTFYISKSYRTQRLTDQEIREISESHEIGAHTLTHPDLRTLTPEEKEREIIGGKQWLEELLGHSVDTFCYPKGFYDDSALLIVKNVGFLMARTTSLGSITYKDNPFQLDTTIQVYPFPLRKLNKKQYYFGKLLQPYIERSPELLKLGVPSLSMYSWLTMAKATFDIALQKGEVFHLWGHSWEIEKYDMWDEFEKLLQYISNRKNCTYITNGELL